MTELFPSAGRFSRGYEEEPVVQFFQEARRAYEGGASAQDISFEEIRRAAFPLVRGGFKTENVDAALSRLESAFIQRDRAVYIAKHGESAWFSKIADEATVLYPRLLRPAGSRFAHPADRGIGYDCAEVDALLDRLAAFFDDQAALSESDLRFALFDTARGENAYVESQVDAFLGKAMYVLLAVS